VRKILYRGTEHECSICGSRLARFKPMANRPAARCPVCGSLERHRMIWLYCQAKTNLFDGRAKRFLHVAPEPCLTLPLRRIKGLEYVGADLEGCRAMVKMDVTGIPFDDASFDVILCSHVLEHVQDDRTAMRELLRILKPGGWAILLVPIDGAITQEDLCITSPEERTRLYGQHDHVRQYGQDYGQRLRQAGFLVSVDAFAAELAPAVLDRYGLLADEDVYYCTKSGWNAR
jgi:SAM-dependent methyltransferase